MLSVVLSVLFSALFVSAYVQFPCPAYLMAFSVFVILGILFNGEVGGLFIIMGLSFLALWLSQGTTKTIFKIPVIRFTQWFFLAAIGVGTLFYLVSNKHGLAVFCGLVASKALVIALLSLGGNWRSIPFRLGLAIGIANDILYYFTDIADFWTHALNISSFVLGGITVALAIARKIKNQQ